MNELHAVTYPLIQKRWDIKIRIRTFFIFMNGQNMTIIDSDFSHDVPYLNRATWNHLQLPLP